jgi:hypothetical protein
LKKLDDDVVINRAWETVRKNINISAKETVGYYELKKHKSWFIEACSNYYITGTKPNCSGYRIQAK